MGNGLFKYAEMNKATADPIPDTPQQRDGMDNYLQRRAALDKSKELMQSIEAQIQQGTPPQYVLYTALRCIGLLTGATEWDERQRAALDETYKDLAQGSMFADNDALAMQRLEDQQAQYIDKTRRKLKRIENETGTIYGMIQAIYDHLAALENHGEIEADSPGQTIYNGNGMAQLHNRWLNQKARERRTAEKYDLNNLELPPNN